jgi:hypothetical protein
MMVVSLMCMMQLLSQDDDGDVYGASVQFLSYIRASCFATRRTRPSYKIGLVWRLRTFSEPSTRRDSLSFCLVS